MSKEILPDKSNGADKSYRISWRNVRKAIELLEERGIPVGGIELYPENVVVFTAGNEKETLSAADKALQRFKAMKAAEGRGPVKPKSGPKSWDDIIL
jgi:hypothetical protein